MRNIKEMMTQICHFASMQGLSMDFALSAQGRNHTDSEVYPAPASNPPMNISRDF